MKIKNKLFTATTLAATMLASMPLQAVEKGDILTRVRIINVMPNVGSNDLKDNTGASMDAGIDVKSAITLDIDVTYMVTNNIGVELLLNLTSKHNVTGTGALSGVDVGNAMVLPPALIAQWHFSPTKKIRPYAGAGINFTMFFNEKTTSQLDDALGGSTRLNIDDAFGLVAQVGVDIDISKRWYINFDAKYIDLNTTAAVSVNNAKVATVDFDLNPLILGVGIGTSF